MTSVCVSARISGIVAEISRIFCLRDLRILIGWQRRRAVSRDSWAFCVISGRSTVLSLGDFRIYNHDRNAVVSNEWCSLCVSYIVFSDMVRKGRDGWLAKGYKPHFSNFTGQLKNWISKNNDEIFDKLRVVLQFGSVTLWKCTREMYPRSPFFRFLNTPLTQTQK